MRRLMAVALALVCGHALLHAAPEALTYDHIHLAFPDTHAATEWYIKYLGATARPDGMDGVFFGPIRFNMRKAAGVVGSGGSIIEAVGLSYADLQGRLRIVLDGSGAKIVQQQHMMDGLGPTAVIEEIASFQTSGVKVLGEPRQDPNVATTFATFFEGPTGRIELTQR